MGQNDILINRAQNDIKDIPEVECNIIIEGLFNAIIKDSAKKKVNAVKGIVDIAQNKNECFGVALSKLKMIPSNSISQPMLVHVGALKSINATEIDTLISEWKDENEKLK